MSKLKGLFAACMLFLPLTVAHAQEWQSCDQWATFTDGEFNVYNNIWGSGAGSQCVWANSYQDWGVNADHPNTSGIKSYPNVSHELSINVNDLGSCNSSFDVTVPRNSGSYTTAYDIWYNDHAYEVMLWMNWNGSVGPISYNYDGNGAVPEATNVRIGGNTWDVYRGSNGSNEVFSFLRTSETTSGSVDITAISQWIQDQGWFGNANLHKIELGYEISGSAGGLSFTTNDYSLSCSRGGSSGGDSDGGSSDGDTDGGSSDGDSDGGSSDGDTDGGSSDGDSSDGNTDGGSSDGDSDGASNDGSLSSGRYVITSRFSDRALTVSDGSTANRANVGLWSYDGGAHQQWDVTELGDGYYSIRAAHSDKSLNASMFCSSPGCRVRQFTYWGGSNQQWQIVEVGDGYYKIVARHNDLALDVWQWNSGDGADVRQWDDNGANNQQWSFSSP